MQIIGNGCGGFLPLVALNADRVAVGCLVVVALACGAALASLALAV